MQEQQLPQRPTAFELSEVLGSLEAAGLTETQIGDKLGLSQGAINHWRHNRNGISAQHWLALCELTDEFAFSDIAQAVIGAPKPHLRPDARREASTRSIVTKLLGPGVTSDAIIDLALDQGETELETFQLAARRCVDQLCFENTHNKLQWDDLFDTPEVAPEEGLSMAQQVHEIVNNRGEEVARNYGPFSEGMERAAKIFSGATGIDVKGRHMYMALVALKLSRQSYNHKDDNLLDAMAYMQGLANYENDAK